MKIGIPKETAAGETRVAFVPVLAGALVRDKHEILVESGAGLRAGVSDAQYTAAGAAIAGSAAELYAAADLVLKVQPPTVAEAGLIRESAAYIGFLAPFSNAPVLQVFLRRRLTGYAMEFIPRITRAQSMDALSSQATIAGYKAVLLAAERIDKMFPLLMTAAGTVTPATVLVLGAGVAGLQAIATAKRLGARVEAFDPRPAVRDQVKSLGAVFVEMELPADAETAGGYAKELSPEFIRKEMEAIGARLPKVDVVISTAQVFGKKAPLLVTKDMIERLRPGAVFVDLAAEQGGNCELTRAGETVRHRGVAIIGAVNLPATVPADASALYARNCFNLFRHLYPKPDAQPDPTDEIVRGACLMRGGEAVNAAVRQLLDSFQGSS
ncbi:MAG TPA: Re/Si-specific NAD(P)(+) transhydrogenase subunit alpha [Opitutaceae bacterium]|nr:Re/Si-specific NAD(P)(+) transhydrogenase subunit alpha [Opitutaceae bacterium]HUJ43610.1 Re/Si-specific NAD(P)(+) transhydrogenase subunit alpha [Opitutaceae bacterium]